MSRVLLSILLSVSTLLGVEPDFGTFRGTAVIVDLNSSEKKVFGQFSDERLHPCSTFKILNSMIALDANVVKDENEIFKWDGKVREYDFWNKDHSMRSAITVSTVWFYQELARRMGKTQMKEMVTKANYGNNDTSKTLSDFWLGNGSLLISASEQVVFLTRFVREELPFSKRAMHIVKEIITLEKKESTLFAGKTGSCSSIGWFVGFVEKPMNTKVFAFVLKGEGASGIEAKRIAMEYFKE